jgi:hypothetical protein
MSVLVVLFAPINDTSQCGSGEVPAAPIRATSGNICGKPTSTGLDELLTALPMCFIVEIIFRPLIIS